MKMYIIVELCEGGEFIGVYGVYQTQNIAEEIMGHLEEYDNHSTYFVIREAIMYDEGVEDEAN